MPDTQTLDAGTASSPHDNWVEQFCGLNPANFSSNRNACVDPDAGEPNQSVDPSASEPDQSVDSSASPPGTSDDPKADQPNVCVDPNADQPNVCVDPSAPGSPLHDAWQAGYDAGYAAPDENHPPPTPYAEDAAMAYAEGAAAGVTAARSGPPAPNDGDSRPLTSQEIANARRIFGDSLDYDDITLTRGKLVSTGAARTIRNTINMEKSEFKPGTFDLTNDGRDTLIHEMTHVWQYQHQGLSYAPEALWAQLKAVVTTGDRNNAYDWRSLDSAGTPWDDWNPEAQAESVEDYNKALKACNSGKGSARDYSDVQRLSKYVAGMQSAPR